MVFASRIAIVVQNFLARPPYLLAAMALGADRHWRELPLEILKDHYELNDSEDGSGLVPTPGEFMLDAFLMTVQRIMPQSDNGYSEFMKRHYITYGGTHEGNVIVKPPWVFVEFVEGERFDRCTLCKPRKWCCDGHLQSKGHRAKVKEWFKEVCDRKLEYRRLPGYKWLLVPPPPPWPPPALTRIVGGEEDQQPPAAGQGGDQQPPAETSDLVWL